MADMLDKRSVLAAYIAGQEDRSARMLAAASHASASATHEESRAEDKYDTRGLEMSYLAAGVGERVAALREALAKYATWTLPTERMGTVRPGALVTLIDDEGLEMTVFVAPFGDGDTVNVEAVAVRVVTLKAPLGAALLGKGPGDEVRLKHAGTPRTWTVDAVS